MKSTALALCALVFAGVAAGQNGNDPLILNNRTGLDPVVYDSFSTSYTKVVASKIQVQDDKTTPVSVTPVSVCVGAKATSETESRVKASPAPNTFMHTTTSLECWHDGYPCSDRGAQYPNFGYPTTPPGVERRMMPIETDSMPADTAVPGPTQIPAETGEDKSECVGVTSTSADFNILPIPSSLGGTDQWTTTSVAEETYNILPIPSSLGGTDQWTITRHRPPLPEITHEYSPIPTSWWRSYYTEDNANIRNNDARTQHRAREADIPTDFWRGPHESIITDSGIASTTTGQDPTATQDPVELLHFPAVPPIATFTDRSYSSFVPASSEDLLPASVAVTDSCYLHYCPDGMSSPGVLPTTMRTVMKAVLVAGDVDSST
ncbi:hypothetical protein E8E13_005394 [Curvularia kusanoi]|uniref:Uncharacterized protein n=1 Tax=Curvularia kusanoi TaxID=90978 RepID=A0A9P4W6Z8_CURKU|nr:hypothetical protein E8E13_005394 [Curvularia kusanoi]